MTRPLSVVIDDKRLDIHGGQTILEVCESNGISLPMLCKFEGLSPVGACRLCLVEIEGVQKLLPACTTLVAPNQVIRTQSERLKNHRRMILELFFSERNHICSVCVANNRCELQRLAYEQGMDHVRFPYLYQECVVDASRENFVLDHNRCILCTRCVRVCEEIEGAHTWDVMGRGYLSRIAADLNQPWGEATSCTSCGKCVQVCPTGALFPKKMAQGTLEKNPEMIMALIEKRKTKS